MPYSLPNKTLLAIILQEKEACLAIATAIATILSQLNTKLPSKIPAQQLEKL